MGVDGFRKWAKYYLSTSGIAEDEVDIPSEYDESLSDAENKHLFQTKYPNISQGQHIPYQGIGSAQRKAQADAYVEEEYESTEKEMQEKPSYEIMGKRSALRRQLKGKTYDEPESIGGISGKDLDINEVGTINRKPSAFETTKERVSEVATTLQNAYNTYKTDSARNREENLAKQEKEVVLMSREQRVKNIRNSIRNQNNPQPQPQYAPRREQRANIFNPQSQTPSWAEARPGRAPAWAEPSSSSRGWGEPPQTSTELIKKERIVVINGRTHKYIEMVKPKQPRRQQYQNNIPLAFRETPRQAQPHQDSGQVPFMFREMPRKQNPTGFDVFGGGLENNGFANEFKPSRGKKKYEKNIWGW